MNGAMDWLSGGRRRQPQAQHIDQRPESPLRIGKGLATDSGITRRVDGSHQVEDRSQRAGGIEVVIHGGFERGDAPSRPAAASASDGRTRGHLAGRRAQRGAQTLQAALASRRSRPR